MNTSQWAVDLEKVSHFRQLIKDDVAVSVTELCSIYYECWGTWGSIVVKALR
jgi:hypothetical protein